ncbi:hypothetical protein [Arthrobacter sp. OAP107]|uniref:hypothetical protein n=1 Tax=Arthrobacter sp. OAP107 TaxID=3156445 RepID=UPI003396BB2F
MAIQSGQLLLAQFGQELEWEFRSIPKIDGDGTYFLLEEVAGLGELGLLGYGEEARKVKKIRLGVWRQVVLNFWRCGCRRGPFLEHRHGSSSLTFGLLFDGSGSGTATGELAYGLESSMGRSVSSPDLCPRAGGSFLRLGRAEGNCRRQKDSPVVTSVRRVRRCWLTSTDDPIGMVGHLPHGSGLVVAAVLGS